MSTATMDIDLRRPRRGETGGTAQAREWAGAADMGEIRLTQRGRVVIMVVLLILAFAAFTMLGAPADSTATANHPVAHTVVVGSGETLWDIAVRIAPGADPRVVIAEIVDLNALPDAGAIRVGQPLDVPRY